MNDRTPAGVNLRARSCFGVRVFDWPGFEGIEMTRIVKLLHPGAQRHEVRRQVRALYFALLGGIVTALLVAGFLYWMYSSGRFLP